MKKKARAKIIFCALFSAAIAYFLWRQIETHWNVCKDISILDSLETYEDVRGNLSEDMKYILLWTSVECAPLYFFRKGQEAFIEKDCAFDNCFVTTNRNFFGGDLTKFNAVFFNGRSLDATDLPKMRSDDQKYIFTNLESADNYPVCDERFDGFFNWTATYKLDSDLPMPYISIRNNLNETMGPKIQMSWDIADLDVKNDTDLLNIISNKTKTVAWFVSNCRSKSKRMEFAKELDEALSGFGLNVDIYGRCGSLQCPREDESKCDKMIESDYHFYLSLENSFAQDYVTEKLLKPLQHYAVPIVYGGADYSRFLPANSYFDARNHTVEKLAAILAYLVSDENAYRKLFWWRKNYSYHDPWTAENVCNVCAALNDKTMFETPTVYKYFRKWWNPKYLAVCPS